MLTLMLKKCSIKHLFANFRILQCHRCSNNEFYPVIAIDSLYIGHICNEASVEINVMCVFKPSA